MNCKFFGLIGLAIMVTVAFCKNSYSYDDGYFGADVKSHYNNFQPKYNYNECRIWIDYEPKREASEIDNETHKVFRQAVLEHNKYMIYFNWKDFGGAPGFHLAFIDYCEQKEELGRLMIKMLVEKFPDIETATIVQHTVSRDNYDTGKPWRAYLDETEANKIYEERFNK